MSNIWLMIFTGEGVNAHVYTDSSKARVREAVVEHLYGMQYSPAIEEHVDNWMGIIDDPGLWDEHGEF